MPEYCSPGTCLLTDRFGNPISPYAQYAVLYASPLNHGGDHWSVAIEGCVAVFSDMKRVSPPIPFCILAPFCLSVPKGSKITFQLEAFHACALADPCNCVPGRGRINLLISIETAAFSAQSASLLVPQVDPGLHIVDRVCISAEQICDSVRIHSERCIQYKNSILQAEISQYNAIADGTKRTFLDCDQLREYGGSGILSPEEVSYYNVFVNGLLQPKKNYILKKGELTFITQDIPSRGQTVIILFVTWKDFNCRAMNVVEWQFSAISDGSKRVYTDADELPEYKNDGIPSPAEVSYFNLYSNGVLQPRTNYCVKKGILELITDDAPAKGAFVILESVVIRNLEGRLFRANNAAYNAYSNGGKIYTDRDEIRMYGSNGIPDPDDSSYQNLFVNGILQPHVNYFVRRGGLILETEDSPAVTAPITLQSVNGCAAAPCFKTQLSDAAHNQLKQKFLCMDDLLQAPNASHPD